MVAVATNLTRHKWPAITGYRVTPPPHIPLYIAAIGECIGGNRSGINPAISLFPATATAHGQHAFCGQVISRH